MASETWVCGIGGWSPSPIHPIGHGQLTFHKLADRNRYEIELGFSHRGDEKLLEVRDYRQGLSLSNRPGWLTPVAFAICYAEAAEELLGLAPSPAGRQSREAILQLQTVIGACGWLAGVAEWLSQPAAPWLQLREELLQVHEQLTGGRLHDSFIRLGGVAAAFPGEMIESAVDRIGPQRLPEIDLAPLAGSGRLEVGAAEFHGDASERVARYWQRASELLASVPSALTEIDPAAPVNVQLPKVVRVPVGQSWSSRPTATGTSGLWLHSNGGKSPIRVSLQPASRTQLSAILETAETLEQLQVLLATVPLCPGEIER